MKTYYNTVKQVFLIVCLHMPVLLLSQTQIDKYDSYLAASNQVVFVTAKSWNANQGLLKLYQRKNNRNGWQIAQQFAVTLGRNGLAFDRRSVLPKPSGVVIKHEGDGKSPVGIFNLGPVFSYHPLQGLHMRFKKVDTTDLCIDDVHSAYYNTLVQTDTAADRDWSSSEHMRPNNDSYEYGVWIKYNSDKIFSGEGSCIFLHVWAGINSSTAGCTAMEKRNMITLIRWLKNKKHPVLLQIVADE